MKSIKIYGCSKDKVRKELVRRAAVYFLSRLLPRKRKIEISIHLKGSLIEKSNVYGECYHMDTRPSKYTIYLERELSDSNLITTLAHEFVHVKQFDKGELVMLHNCNRWLGKRYSHDEFDVTEEPWEVEPCELEYHLAAEFFSQ